MNQQEVASILEQDILNRVKIMFDLLPSNLTKENKDKCADICRGIEQLTTEAFAEADHLGIRDFFSGWRRVLIPYWSMTYGLTNAYGKGFTWDAFLDYALECNCSKIEKRDNYNRPSFAILNKHNNPEFVVALEKED